MRRQGTKICWECFKELLRTCQEYVSFISSSLFFISVLFYKGGSWVIVLDNLVYLSICLFIWLVRKLFFQNATSSTIINEFF